MFEQEIGLQTDAMLGYSLGYSEFCAAGTIGLSDVLKHVDE